MGRPRLADAAARRDVPMHVLTTKGERDELQRAADDASMSCSTWIRSVALERARGFVESRPAADARALEWRVNDWLRKIEALAPGDACEFHYPARVTWLPGTVVLNGGSGYWSVRDDSDAEGWRGRITESLYIEMIRIPGQTEAWQRVRST